VREHVTRRRRRARLEHEHERAAGRWHAEWKALSDALAYTGARRVARETLDGLEVDAERMRSNLRAETLSEAERFAPDAREPEDYLGAADALRRPRARVLQRMSTVVLSGSLGATAEMWEPQANALRDFDVVRIEHPGHDGAPMEDVRDLRDLALRVLELVPGERFSFVGLSLGGAVGMHLALEAPGRLDRLVLAATSARFGTPETWDERIALCRAGRDGRRGRRGPARWFTPAFGDVQRLRDMLLSTPPEVYMRYCELLRELRPARPGRLDRGADARVAGAEDPTSPPEHLEAIAAEIPQARVVVIPRAAHLANVERPGEFNEALLAHLR
jgi:3-oxoadipate enol-lactonase